MKSIISFIVVYFLLLIASSAVAQEAHERKVVITGVRFSYPLVEHWISEYKKIDPNVHVSIDPRTVTDPVKYDLLIESFEPEETIKESREYLYLARYSLLPVANAKSGLARIYQERGLTRQLLTQIYFHDLFADQDKKEKIDAVYTVYSRLQKAGAPITFAHHFGFEQEHFAGKKIAGADEHLIKAVLKDSTAVSYGFAGLVYDLTTRKPQPGLVVLPLDNDNNGKLSQDERSYTNLDQVIEKFERSDKALNIPIEYIHISLRKHGYSAEALKFLLWVIDNGQTDLHHFGFLSPNPQRYDQEKEKFQQLARQ
jgi:phosphate transport system substrate-binding protein